jgi:hypothetical protein
MPKKVKYYRYNIWPDCPHICLTLYECGVGGQSPKVVWSTKAWGSYSCCKCVPHASIDACISCKNRHV